MIKIINKILLIISVYLFASQVMAWTINEDIDPFTDEGKIYISIDGLTFRCSDNRFDILIHFDEYIGSDVVKGIYRFDKKQAVETKFGISTEGTTVFVKNTNQFTSEAMQSNKLIIRVFDYNGTAHTKSFVLKGLPVDKMHLAAELCGIEIVSTSTNTPTPAADNIDTKILSELESLEPKQILLMKQALNEIIRTKLLLTPVRDNDFYLAIDKYFSSYENICKKDRFFGFSCMTVIAAKGKDSLEPLIPMMKFDDLKYKAGETSLPED